MKLSMAATTLLAGALAAMAATATAQQPPRAEGGIRVATFNASLYAETSGGVLARLAQSDEAAKKIAAVIQTVRPDVLLVNEFDYDESGKTADRFQRDYLGRGKHGRRAIQYKHRYFAPVNTGVPSGFDLDADGKVGGANDAWGYGKHAGEYGMLVLSTFPIDEMRVRTFQKFKWRDMPGALVPVNPDGKPFYSAAAWKEFRLSSKSHWDVPIETPQGTLHFLVSHPTPPVFDGPEDRNGRRNHDEVRLWADYIDPAKSSYLVDDAGKRGGLAGDAAFVIAGDLNADPLDGDSWPGTPQQLLQHPRIRALPAPASKGAIEAAHSAPEHNAKHHTDPRLDTGAFGGTVGNLRIDYALPSKEWSILGSGVFWPKASEGDAKLIDASDHHMVWVDLKRVE